MEKQYYYAYSKYLKEKYGEKVYKLPVNLPVTCPNRKEGGGCLFCADAGTGFEAKESKIDVHDGNFIEREAAQRRIARLLQIAEKVAQVEEIFIDRFLRVGFDGLVVG